VVLLVIGTTVRLAASGIAIGLAASLPVAFAAVILVLTLVAMLASWLPAYRTTKIEPTMALREWPCSRRVA
jgi:ABC-type antimicrobial peptide transport system permease subunit